MVRRILERGTMGCLGLIPTKFAQHVLHLLRSQTELADRWGYHIRPIHYYDPLPDFRGITVEQISTRRIPISIDFRLDAQKTLIERLGKQYRDELATLASASAPTATISVSGRLPRAL